MELRTTTGIATISNFVYILPFLRLSARWRNTYLTSHPWRWIIFRMLEQDAENILNEEGGGDMTGGWKNLYSMGFYNF
jgi:hypothetical protein